MSAVGHWCEFCQQTHVSTSCWHPGQLRLAAALAELEKARAAVKATGICAAHIGQPQDDCPVCVTERLERIARVQSANISRMNDAMRDLNAAVFENSNEQKALARLDELRGKLETALARVARLEAALREIADYLPPEDWDKGVDWQHQLALFVRAARAAMEAQP